MKNSYLFFNNNFIKILIILFSNSLNFNFYFLIIISNLLIIILCADVLVLSKLNKKNKKKFRFINGLNTFVGGSITSFDKVYASKYLTEFISNYYIIFRVASIFQTITAIFKKKDLILPVAKSKNIFWENIKQNLFLFFYFNN